MPTVQKIFLSILLALVLVSSSFFPVFASKAYAQTPAPSWYNQDIKDWYVKVYDSPANDVFGERYTSAQVQWIFYGLFSNTLNASAGLVGISPKDISCVIRGGAGLVKNITQSAPAQAIQNILPQTKPFAFSAVLGSCGLDKILRNFGLISYQTNESTGIAEFILFTDRPLSGISYFRNVARNWHIIPEAKAQTPGFGFNALNPVLPLWRASRNVAYAVLVFAIIILSFMIMFRVKINPQTVVTVQSAIPKVVFALILITFSYAIAGFMVDLMYVVIGFISLIFSGAWSSLGFTFLRVSSTSDMFKLLTIGPPFGPIEGTGIFGTLFVYLSPLVILIILLLVGGILLIPVGGVGIILIVISLVIIAALLIFFFRVVWMLFKAFAYVVLFVIFAPLQIALGVIIPSLGFGQWIRGLAANLAVFPITGTFFALSAFFIGAALNALFQSATSSNLLGPAGWPPLLGSSLAGAGGISVAILYIGLSLVIFAIIPKVSDIIKAVIEGKPFAYGTAIGEAIVGPFPQVIRGVSIATEIGRAWSTRFGLRAGGVAPTAPAGTTGTPPPPPTP